MNKTALKAKGRTLTYILRHGAEEYGVPIEYTGGWAYTDKILSVLGISLADLQYIVDNDDKGRFSFGLGITKIRANQGHSMNVNLELTEEEPPEFLYHGTVLQFIDAIMADGLKKMSRHHVHLSDKVSTAVQVASRRKSDNVILKVLAKEMYDDGYTFYKSSNGVWLTDHVPDEYLKIL